jgi:hypothetical protein
MRDLEGTRMMREGWADPGQTNRNKTNQNCQRMVGTRGEIWRMVRMMTTI